MDFLWLITYSPSVHTKLFKLRMIQIFVEGLASIIEEDTGRWSERIKSVDHVSMGMLVGITRELQKKRRVLDASRRGIAERVAVDI